MIDYLEDLLKTLRPVFSRRATFVWFVIAFIGLMIRTDTYGVTSIIRALSLSPACYPCLLHFFHSSAWNLQTFLPKWWLWLIRQNVEYRVNERVIFTGDHTKNVKDGRKIPKVETLHQDSETGSKPSYFRGHHWGFVGLLTHAKNKFWSTPLWAEIHQENFKEKRSTRIISMALSIAQTIQSKGYLILDAYFSVGPVFLKAKKVNGDIIHIITRAKKNITAFLPAVKKKKTKRGRQPLYGKKLKLMKLFDSKKSKFLTVHAEVYGKMESVQCLVLDLLWKPVKGFLRFILIQSSHGRIILITSDFSLTAETAIFLYCKRASIETLFDSLKNLLAGLSYHFWSKYLHPSSRRPFKKNKSKPISDNPPKTRLTLQAIEKFVTLQMLVLGYLQLLALKFPQEIIASANCWLRTPSANIPSEFMAKHALANLIHYNLIGFAKNMITLIIQKHRVIPMDSAFLEEVA